MGTIPDAVDILSALSGAGQPDLPPGTKLATIDPAYTLGGSYPSVVPLPQVTFDGETTMSAKQYPIIQGYLPLAGQRVLMVPSGRTYVIVGAINTPVPRLHALTALMTASGISVPLDGPPRAGAHLTSSMLVNHDPSLPGTNIPWTGAVDYNSLVTWSGLTPDLFTILVPGLYTLKGCITYSASNVGQRWAILVANGATLNSKQDPNPTSLFACTVEVQDEVYLAAGATVALQQLQNTGGVISLVPRTRLAIRRVSG